MLANAKTDSLYTKIRCSDCQTVQQTHCRWHYSHLSASLFSLWTSASVLTEHHVISTCILIAQSVSYCVQVMQTLKCKQIGTWLRMTEVLVQVWCQYKVLYHRCPNALRDTVLKSCQCRMMSMFLKFNQTASKGLHSQPEWQDGPVRISVGVCVGSSSVSAASHSVIASRSSAPQRNTVPLPSACTLHKQHNDQQPSIRNKQAPKASLLLVQVCKV